MTFEKFSKEHGVRVKKVKYLISQTIHEKVSATDAPTGMGELIIIIIIIIIKNNVYGAVIVVTYSHCESSPGSS